MTKQQAIDKVCAWMDEQVGYKETPVNVNKYAAYMDTIADFYNGKKNGYPWCDVFVDCGFVQCFGAENAMKMLYQPTKSCGAGCEFSAGYYKANNAFFSKPEVGDQVFYSNYDHTGFVREVNGSQIICIDGNWGDQVTRRVLPITDGRIDGYGRPDWAVVAEEPAPKPELTVSFTLQQGSRGNAVELLQMGLILAGIDVPYGIDGKFGQATKAALVTYQKTHGLQVDGIAGSETFNSLLG